MKGCIYFSIFALFACFYLISFEEELVFSLLREEVEVEFDVYAYV